MSKKKELSPLDIPESYQRYLDEIYQISRQKRGGWVTNKQIAESFNFDPASVSGMLHKLKKEGLIQWVPRKSLRLTEKGKEIAMQLNETHSLLRVFFEKVVKINDKKVVEKLSCDIEHHITEDVKKAFKKFISEYLDDDECC